MAKVLHKSYNNSMTGIPQITNAWGSLTTLLDAVLVNGFNIKPITSLARVGQTATAFSPGHGYVLNQVVDVSGFDQTEYNGEFIVTRVTADMYDFTVTGAPATPATGAGTAKAASLGFSLPFTATNKRAYRSNNLSSNRPYLRVDDSLPANYDTSWGKTARITMAQNMTDIDTFVGARAPFNPNFPTQNETPTGVGGDTIAGWYRWYYAWACASCSAASGDGGNYSRIFSISGDDRGFYFTINPMPNETGSRCLYAFNDFSSYKAGDGFNTLLMANDRKQDIATTGWYPGYGGEFSQAGNSLGKILMRDYTQIGGNTGAQLICLNVNNNTLISGTNAIIPFPNGPDYSLVLLPLFIKEERRGDLRGTLPGLYFTPQLRPYDDGTIIENVIGYEGRKFLCISAANSSSADITDTGRVFIDLTGPWR